MNRRSLRASLLLLLTAAIWGAAFVAQRVGMDRLGPLTFNGTRMMLAGLALIPVAVWSGRRAGGRGAAPGSRREQRTAGLLCGLLLFVSSTLQQFGLMDTTAGKAGFITALYVVLVPVVNFVLFRAKVSRWIALSVAMAVAGLFLICVPYGQTFMIGRGDLLVLGCAVCFTGHILVVDHYRDRVDGVRLSCTQFLICGALSLAGALLTEKCTWADLTASAVPILYAGILSGAVGYTLQIIAQKDINPTVASLLMAFESVFAVLTGVVVLGETMSVREGVGCAVMFAAVVLSQLPHRERRGQNA